MLSRVTAKNVGDVFLRHTVVRVRCRGKESSLSLSHLLMSFLFGFTGKLIIIVVIIVILGVFSLFPFGFVMCRVALELALHHVISPVHT